jgi:hypothetical protein
MDVGFLIPVMVLLAIISIALQVMINRDQDKINKELSKFVDLSIEKFDQIDKALEKFNIKQKEIAEHEKRKKEWYLTYGDHKDDAKNEKDNLIKKTDSLSPNPDFTQAIVQAIALSNIISN